MYSPWMMSVWSVKVIHHISMSICGLPCFCATRLSMTSKKNGRVVYSYIIWQVELQIWAFYAMFLLGSAILCKVHWISRNCSNQAYLCTSSMLAICRPCRVLHIHYFLSVNLDLELITNHCNFKGQWTYCTVAPLTFGVTRCKLFL